MIIGQAVHVVDIDAGWEYVGEVARYAGEDRWLVREPLYGMEVAHHQDTFTACSPSLTVAYRSPAQNRTPTSASADNAIADVLTEQYGFVPFSVRYGAARAARAVVERWRATGEVAP